MCDYHSSAKHVPDAVLDLTPWNIVTWKLVVINILTVPGRTGLFLRTSSSSRRHHQSKSAVLSGEAHCRNLRCRRRASPEW